MDTLAISEKLIASGVPEAQAKAHATAIKEVAEESAKESQDGLATKADIAELRAELRADNAKLRQEMADRDTQMTRFTVGAMMGGMTVMTAIFGVIVALAIQSLS